MKELKELLQQLKDYEALKVRYARAEEAHACLDAIVISLDDAIVSSTLDGIIMTWNPGVGKIYDYSAEEIFGHPISLLVSPCHRDEMPTILSKIARGKRIENYETVGMRRDGKPIRISLGVFPIKDASSKITSVLWIVRDITDRKRAEEALRKSEELSRSRMAELQVIYATAPIGLCFVDTALRFVSINEKLAAMNGLSVEEHLGRTVCEATPLLVDFSEPYLRRIIHTGKPVEGLEIHGTTRAQPGIERDWPTYFYPVRDQAGEMLGVNVVVQEITEQKRVEDELRFQTLHDPLTGLPNRMLFLDRLHLELGETRRNHKMLAVMFLDLDNFKNINDTLGHSIGDKLLKKVAGRLKTCIRETDTIARIGGDEFNILLADISHTEDAVPIAKKIMSLFKGPFEIDNEELYVTASIGISICPIDGESAEALVKNADIAMYHAKEQGRDNYQFHSSAVNIRTLERMLLENDLHQMIECGELVLHYQAQLNIDSRQMLCAEALVRWRHPKLGLLSPSRFLPIAEERGHYFYR